MDTNGFHYVERTEEKDSYILFEKWKVVGVCNSIINAEEWLHTVTMGKEGVVYPLNPELRKVFVDYPAIGVNYFIRTVPAWDMVELTRCLSVILANLVAITMQDMIEFQNNNPPTVEARDGLIKVIALGSHRWGATLLSIGYGQTHLFDQLYKDFKTSLLENFPLNSERDKEALANLIDMRSNVGYEFMWNQCKKAKEALNGKKH